MNLHCSARLQRALLPDRAWLKHHQCLHRKAIALWGYAWWPSYSALFRAPQALELMGQAAYSESIAPGSAWLNPFTHPWLCIFSSKFFFIVNSEQNNIPCQRLMWLYDCMCWGCNTLCCVKLRVQNVFNLPALHMQGSAQVPAWCFTESILHRVGDSKVCLGMGLMKDFISDLLIVKGSIKTTSALQHCTVKNRPYEHSIYQSIMVFCCCCFFFVCFFQSKTACVMCCWWEQQSNSQWLQ